MLIVTHLANVRYLTGFTGTAALVLVGRRDTLLISDFRYKTQAAGEVGMVIYRALLTPSGMSEALLLRSRYQLTPSSPRK